MTLVNKLTAIADAVREETGLSEKMTLDEIADIVAKDTPTYINTADDLVERTITEFTLGEANSIGMYAFYKCTSLTNVDLLNLTSVSEEEGMKYSFYNCTGLTAIDLSNLTTVSGINGMQYTFQSCTGLESVDLSGLTTVSGENGMGYTFYNCKNLTNVDLSSLTTISGTMHSVFRNCTRLTSLDLPKLETIASKGLYYAFNGTGVTSLYLPVLTSLGQRGFCYCTDLTKIWLPSTCTTITATSYSYAPFYNCSSTLEIYTDVASEDDIPSGWGAYWNYYASDSTLTIHYGATIEEFEAA